MNEFLQKIITNKTAIAKELRKKIKESQDADEVRALGDTLQSVLDELNDAKEKLDELEDEGEGGQEGQEGESSEGENRGEDFSKETRGKFNPIKSYSQSNGKKEERNVDPYDTEEYRTAFMNYVCRNTPIPKEVIPTEIRTNAVTTTTDAGAVIPTSILNEIITELKSYGNIYNKVRKLNIQGGVQVPILSLKPTASWIGETTTSDDQKIQAKDKISFNYYGLECKIAQTLLVNVTTLAMFQELFVPNYDLLPYLDKKVKEYDFNYAIHLHGPDMPLYPDADDVWENVKDLDPRIGMCLDIGHDRRNGKDPVADLEKYISRVFDIHLKDVTGASKAGYSVEVGRGILDIPGFVRMLRKTGYDGVVSLEHERNMKDPFIGIAESIGYFRGVVATTSDQSQGNFP